MKLSSHSPNIKRPPPNRAIVLRNTTCAYCGMELSKQSTTKEHVIGRHFVPKGTLNKQWNLILYTCIKCNNVKSDLENDISAISMQPDAYGLHMSDDPGLVKESKRKAVRSISRLTNRAVQESHEKLFINAPLGPGVDLSLSLIAPPQVTNERIYALSQFHLRGFFYFITYNEIIRKGGFWPGVFCPLQMSKRSDWGNPIAVSFMKTIHGWPIRLHAIGASTYFKIVIRRFPEAECWSWALEWNQNYRIIGYFGSEDAISHQLKSLPPLGFVNLPSQPGSNEIYRYRLEIPLNEIDDTLFSDDDVSQA